MYLSLSLFLSLSFSLSLSLSLFLSLSFSVCIRCAPQPGKAMLTTWDDTTNFQEPPRPGGTGANQVPSVGKGSARMVDADTLINCFPSRRQATTKHSRKYCLW
jgi:hypothetical protein